MGNLGECLIFDEGFTCFYLTGLVLKIGLTPNSDRLFIGNLFYRIRTGSLVNGRTWK